MNVMKKLKDARKNRKGFTLVELIVVLVILAILAAIMVPALTGWIDKAKEKQYVIDARSIYLAAQGMASEKYGEETNPTTICVFTDDELNEILALASPSAPSKVHMENIIIAYKGASGADAYTIDKMQVVIDTTPCTFDNGVWTIDAVSSAAADWSNRTMGTDIIA